MYFTEGLQVAGLQISSGTGSMGGSSKILIRGVSSISGNNQPLFVIDGVPVEGSDFNSTETHMNIGLTYTSELKVTEDVTAKHVGSGDLPVLATPSMIALMENAAMNAVKDELEDGLTTVGASINTNHVKPTAI